jgi:hypothetical protein
MNYHGEINSLAGETVAIQTVLANVLREVGKIDSGNPELWLALSRISPNSG